MPGQETESIVAHLVQGEVLRDVRLAWIFDASAPSTTASRQQVGTASSASIEVLERDYEYVMVMTQTCDLQRIGKDYEFITVCPVVQDSERSRVSQVEAGHEPKAIAVPWHEIPVVRTKERHEGWVALPSMAVSMERPVAAAVRTCGRPSEAQRRMLAEHLGRFYSRSAIPGEVIDMLRPLSDLAKKREGKNTTEGEVFGAVKEIRLRTSPDYDTTPPWQITVVFIVDSEWLPDAPKKRRRKPRLQGDEPFEQLAELITRHRASADQETATRLWRETVSRWIGACKAPPEVSRLRFVIRTHLTPEEYAQSDTLDLRYLTTYRRATRKGHLEPHQTQRG